MAEYHENASKLQEAMKRRREELHLDQKDLPGRGGPSRVAIIRYEKGEIPRDIRPSTLDKIDASLQWPKNHAAEILEPPVAQRVSEQPAPSPWEAPRTKSISSEGIDLRGLAQFAQIIDTMQQTLREEIKQIPEAVEKSLQDVTIAQTKLLLDLTRRLTEDDA